MASAVDPLRNQRGRRWVGALLIAILMTPPFVSGSEPTQRRVVGDLEIALSISAPGQGTGQRQDPARFSSNGELHTLTVTVVDRETRSPVTRARLTANVAEETYAGMDYALIPAVGGERGFYFAKVPMPGRVTYRILVQIHVASSTRIREAQFQYRHHH